ncbi:MAG: hypothetical protein OHK0023_15980 [Anaerolineae bacterium]
MRIVRLMLLCVIVASAAFAATTTSAQSGPIVAVTVSNEGKSSFYTFTGDSQQPTLLIEDAGELTYVLSPRGDSYYIYGRDETDTFVVRYAKLGSDAKRFDLTPYQILSLPVWSQAGDYLALTTGTVEGDFSLVVINTADNTVAELKGKFAFEEKDAVSGVLFGVPFLLYWDTSASLAVVQMVIPFSEGNNLGLYKLDLSSALSTNTISTAQLTPYGKVPRGIYNSVLSPNALLAATPMADPNQPIPGYVQDSPYLPPNSILWSDLSAGGEPQPIELPEGVGLDSLTWSQDSTRLFFRAGTYANSSEMVDPKLYSYTIPENTLTEHGVLPKDADARISQLIICGERAFWLSFSTDTTTTLFSASVDALDSPTQLLQEKGYMSLSCHYPQ